MAHYYYQVMCSDEVFQSGAYLGPLESALRDLELVSHMVLPYLNILDLSSQFRPFVHATTIPAPSNGLPEISSVGLQYLLDIVAADPDIKGLIWNPLGPYLNLRTTTKISGFLRILSVWASQNEALFARLSIEEWLFKPGHLTYEAVNKYPLHLNRYQIYPKKNVSY
ncbi:hypothetical protein BJX70DRAFT_2556 [Aspergillus crustosus]